MKIFVNEAITNGINSYIAYSDNKEYAKEHVFELKIIEFLVKLYGRINILNPYQISNEQNLIDNLIVYGASSDDIKNLFELLNKYNDWLTSNSREKNTIIKDIFDILSLLVIFKNKSVVISSEEMKYYEEFLSLNDPAIKKIAEMSAESIDSITKCLENAIIDDEKESNKIEEPLLLSMTEYEKYGLSIEDVEKLPEDKIKQLNEEIKNRNASDTASGGNTKKDSPLQLVLTSGNGFVDALVLFSIMCTEIMVGIVITVLIARF